MLYRYGAALRRAAVAQFEVRLRVTDNAGAWRLVVSSPTGMPLCHQLLFIPATLYLSWHSARRSRSSSQTTHEPKTLTADFAQIITASQAHLDFLTIFSLGTSQQARLALDNISYPCLSSPMASALRTANLCNTGHEFGEENVSIYKESRTQPLVYQSVHGKSEGPRPLAGVPVMAPYSPLEILQQKRLAARRHKTTYCYDFPSVFQTALRDIWAARAVNGEPGSKPAGWLAATELFSLNLERVFSAAQCIPRIIAKTSN